MIRAGVGIPQPRLAVDQCRKPVLAAIQGYCLGGAIDLIAACDMRYAAEDAQFSIKEIDTGISRITSRLGPSSVTGWLLRGTLPNSSIPDGWGPVW